MNSNSIRNNTLEFSAAGSEVIDDTAVHTGNFGAIQVINDAVFNDLIADAIENVEGLEGITVNAGTVLYGSFTSIDLSSGVVVAHRF